MRRKNYNNRSRAPRGNLLGMGMLMQPLNISASVIDVITRNVFLKMDFISLLDYHNIAVKTRGER